ncbi:MAG: 3-deoxy-8-phosphooctulonate synthase [Polyangiaceae bacterium]
MTSIAISIGDVVVGGGAPFVFVGGPCVIESEVHALRMAHAIADIARRHAIPFVFKSSFDKANRTSARAFRGVRFDEGLRILERVKRDVGVKVLTDIHEPHHAAPVSEVVDVLQIPAFLCRQTDLLVAAADTGAVVNVKKGQFLSPAEVGHVLDKVRSAGNPNVMITERGTSFGYNDLVVDMRGLVAMREFRAPVVLDVTHALQSPGGRGDRSGGRREFAPYLLNAGVAIGIDAVFMEVHDDPDNAPSDGPNMVRLDDLERMLVGAKRLDALAKHDLY